MKTILTILILALSFCCKAQSPRDIFIKDSIQTVLNTDLINSKPHYNKVKSCIAKLEKQYGYETDLKRRLLEAAYTHNDLNFLKQELSVLVRDHGFNVAYMSGTENYSQAIMTGRLAVWFKEMYIKNNSEWLRNNFDKQIELRKLNAMHEKDQYLTYFAMEALNVRGLDSLQQKAIKKHLAKSYSENISTLIDITAKYGEVPNEKNFAALQKGYDTVLVHNFQFPENLEEAWAALFPYFKKAYINNEITDVIFRNYDFYCYQHYGYQVFDSFTLSQIPEQFRKGSGKIPVKDPQWLEKIKAEFKWKS